MSSMVLMSFLAYMPCGPHGTLNSTWRPCAPSFCSISGRDAAHSFFASGNEVARNGTTSMPKIGLSFSRIEIRISPVCAWPVATARLISGPLNSDAPAWTEIVSLPPVASATSLAKMPMFSRCGLSIG